MNKQNKFFINRHRLGVAALLVMMTASLFIITPQPVYAQTDANQFVNNILTPIWAFMKKAYEKGGAAAFQKVVRTALNKFAYDAATKIGSGGEGQQPMFVTEGWGQYLEQMGDEAAGQFIEEAVNNWNSTSDKTKAQSNCQPTYTACIDKCDASYTTEAVQDECYTKCSNTNASCLNKDVSARKENRTIAVCSPTSIEAKLSIAMGLVDYNRPVAPNCTASDIVKNWDDYRLRIQDMGNDDWLDKFKGIFNPVSNDIGIYMALRSNMTKQINVKAEDTKTKLVGNGGWLDLQDIAGNIKGMPGDAELTAEMTKQGYISNMAVFSGDALVDAANVFLNQLAMTAYNKWVGNLATESATNENIQKQNSDTSINYGETVVKESAAHIIEPDFTVRADYDILSTLTMCRDRNNPGPTECVIDDKLMQGITEKKTVAEALKEGFLHREWLFTPDYRDNAYSLRNIQIMRKYRLVPLGWEVAAEAGKPASLVDLISCYSASDSYNEYSSNFDVRNQAWCRGLVDPNWVLKAPLNYCAKQGYSSQILNISVVPDTSVNGGANAEKVQITRAEDYCADDKTCIKEKSDGSCEAYGYCQSERRTWNFDSRSCEPIDNTCSAFINSSANQRVAYLENTLDYGNCSADTVGCKQYSLFGDYTPTTGQVAWSETPVNNAYFNDKLSGCSASDEGCKEMLRVKPGWGSNLVMGADFANDKVGDTTVNQRVNNYWSIWGTGNQIATIIDASTLNPADSGKAIMMDSVVTSASTTVGLYSNNSRSLIPTNLNILSGETYTLSADVYLINGDSLHLVLGDDYQVASSTATKNVWRHLSVTRSLQDKPMSEMTFSVVGYKYTSGTVKFAVRNLKLEMTSWDSGFTSYGSYKVYEKLLPPYLEEICYENIGTGASDYRLRANAPEVCNNYARKCNREEAGCERYTEASTGFSVAAQAISSDYCDSSCNGYDLYVARESYFTSPFAEKMIPEKSDACTAEAAGCSEFTNLDSVAAGGESKEYYTQLKQCIKPGASCADFYTWVGTEESGYQLKSVTLQMASTTAPAVTANDSLLCNPTVFNLPPGDPGFNPDCKQYYNKAGLISYHLSASTITCSDNCHAYRLADNNIDSTVSQAQCTGTSRSWNASIQACYVCKNGGTWNTAQKACIYQAIPNEGKKCIATQKGCQEYNGSLGNNTKLIGAYSFETGLDAWQAQCGDDAISSQVANVNNGKSLMYDRGANASGATLQTACDTAAAVGWLDKFFGDAIAAPASYIRRILGTSVTQGQAYSLKFTASAANMPAQVNFAFLSGADKMSYFNATAANPTGTFTIPGDSDWHTYELTLSNLDHAVDAKEALIIVSNRDFYLDNIVLTAITDRYYLIKNTSNIPDVCFYDMLDNYQGADYNLGCSLYNDRGYTSHYLRQFSKLCQDSAVGCELMVDTANYKDYMPGVWQDTNANGSCDTNEPDCVSVSGDRFFYAIYDEARRCNGVDLGCSLLGQAVSSGATLDFSDVYKRNNPNNYSQSLCAAGDAGCEAWKYVDGSGTSYFKNPGNNTCVYRTSTDAARPGKDWYKVPVMRCDFNNNGKIDGGEKTGQVCTSVDDCGSSQPCLVDNNDYLCASSYFETIGIGGGGNQVPVPSELAGLCEPAASGCTEYIDPVSVFSANIVFNPLRETNNGWTLTAGTYQQDLTIEPNKLYIFSVNNGTASTTMSNDVRLVMPSGISILQENNSLLISTTSTLTIPSNQTTKRFIFHSRGNTTARVVGSIVGTEVMVKEAIIDYQLKQNIDKKSCNGLVNFDNGCVLFNERSVDGGQGLRSLSGGWNAATSIDGQAPLVCTSGNCNANQLVKVRPNRVCASWLDCLTYAEDPETKVRTCYALGACNRLNDNNECVSFVKGTGNIIASSTADMTKLDGYSVLNKYDLASMKEVGLNTEAHYSFEEGSPTLTCRLSVATTTACSFNKGIVADSIINSPSNAPTDYPAEGNAYLRVMASQQIAPHTLNSPISVQTNQDYYVNYLANTKGAGLNTKVTVYNTLTGAVIASSTASANNGWERKVFKIPAAKLGTASLINLYLGTDSNSKEERYVYYDDVNIEPVLQVDSDAYVAKECRLYPTQDSASCTSKNSQVVSDGLVGYCLQHDQANKNVCLLWYPIDKISAAVKSSRSLLGYQGAYPLNYCTEADGNFSLLEKRKTVKVDTAHSTDENEWGGDSCTVTDGCNGDANYNQITEVNNGDVSAWRRVWCSPKVANLLTHTSYKIGGADACSTQTVYDGWGVYNGFKYWAQGQAISDGCGNNCDTNCESGDCENLDESLSATPNVRVYDYDKPTLDEEQLKLVSSTDTDNVFFPTCKTFTQVVDSSGNNKAWSGRTSKGSIYPYDTPVFFRDATNYYGQSCYIPGQCISTCTCGNQCECGSGYDYCSYPCNSPGDCEEYSPDVFVKCGTPGSVSLPDAFNFTAYGRNRDLVPFGAATFPDNFNIFASDPVMFRNQYSTKIEQTAFAGRPYGCSGVGCSSLGYCSLNPQVLCILDSTISSSTSLVNQKSCGAVNGTCVPLWNGAKLAASFTFKAENILKNIFLSSFTGYQYSTSTNAYIIPTLAGYNTPSYATTLPQCGTSLDHLSPNNDALFSKYFCTVYPLIKNVKLNGLNIAANGFNVSNPGIYTLTFNSIIDPEQQPMKDLVINWGDSIQTLVNQDNRPDDTYPHKIYHFYKGDMATTSITVKISDNWGKFCCSRNSTGSCGAPCP